MDGWIKLYRSMLEWEWYDDINTKCVFIHCLLMANFEPKKWRGIDVQRGSFITSVSQLAEQTHLSEQSVRTSLNKLKLTKELTIKSTNKFTIITITNYDSYQQLESQDQQTNQQANQQTTNKQLTNNQQTTNNNVRIKERKKERSKEENKETHKEKRTDGACEFDFFEFFKNRYDLQQNLINDWKRVRKAARGVNTETAARKIAKQIDIAISEGHTAAECIEEAVAQSWRGFEASWLKKKCSEPVSIAEQRRINEEYFRRKYGSL